MKFLGLRLDAHDSSITYTDGPNVKYYKPERHNQIKHFGYDNLKDWPQVSKILGFNIEDLNAIALVIDVPKHSYLPKEDPDRLYEYISIPYLPFTEIKCPVFRIDHHYAHSLSSWMLTDTEEHFVHDGFGDLERSISIFNNQTKIKSYNIHEIESFGRFLGDLGKYLKVEGHPEDIAGKLMALQSFGQIDKGYWNLIQNLSYEDFSKVSNYENYKRCYQSNIACELNLLNYLSTIHLFTENKLPEFFKKYLSDKQEFTYSGGVAHNVCVNTKLKEAFSKMIIPPHCADEGLSLGCVEFLRRHYEQPAFSKQGFPFWQSDTPPDFHPQLSTIKRTAEHLAAGKIVGWYQGQGEVGPRALGNRSILMSPEVTNGKHILNEKVKHREDYRPFAASIKLDKAPEYFDWQGESPFMQYSVKFKDRIFDPISHIDGTSRIQTVKPNHQYFYQLLSEFEKVTGIPMLLNTSLNDNGKPIAGNPKDAINLLRNSELDMLVIGDKVVI